MMTKQSTVVIDHSLRAYDFGPSHPLGPIRLLLTYDTLAARGLLASDAVRVVTAESLITDTDLTAVHSSEFLAAVRAASESAEFSGLQYGIGTPDVPRFAGMDAAARLVCAATMTAAEAVISGQTQHAVNLAGGLHHAMPDHASGFCIYNDIAVAINRMLESGIERVAYIDVDAHHGDGVERIFWNDPRVLTISIHQSGRTLFPGTGFAEEVGGEAARGFAVNLALPPHTQDDQWLRAFDAVVPELLAEFSPQVIFSQHGCDSHRLDPLTSMELSIDGQRRSYEMIHEWAHQFADGKWVAVGGGGYALEDVVPRIWPHLVAISAHQPELIDFTDDEPANFKSFSLGWDPHSEVDRAIMNTRKAVFPLHGLIADPVAGF